MLLRRPGFTATAVLCLALAIGATTTIFTLVEALFLRPLPVHEPERLVAIYGSEQRAASTGLSHLPVSFPNYRDMAAQSGAVSELAAYSWTPINLAGGGEPERIFAQIATTNYFDVLGVRAVLGRTFDEKDDRSPVAMLSHVAWRDRFGGDPEAIGRTLLLNNQGFTIIGVMPEGFRGTANIGSPQLWVPMGMHRQVYPFSQYVEERKWRLMSLVGRLAPSATPEQARSDLTTIASRLEQEYPNDNKGRGVKVLRLSDSVIHPDQQENFTLAGALPMAIVALVLLIACSSVACLLLVRATARRHEMAIRLSMGATRGRVVRQLLTESLLLALLAGALGLLLAYRSKDLLWALRPPFLPEMDLGLNGRVLVFALGVSILTGILFGLAPALQVSRPRLSGSLKSRTGEPGGAFSIRNSLVVAQIALSTVSLVGAGLFLRSLNNARQVDLGFDAENLLGMSFDLGAQGYDGERRRQFRELLLEEVRSLPGVRAATLSENGVLDPAAGVLRRVAVESEALDPTGGTLIRANGIVPDYLGVLGIPLVRGRPFGPGDREDSPRVAIVNETMAKSLWPGEDPLGQRFVFLGEPGPVEVVGIARDSKYDEVTAPPQPYIYLPLDQRDSPTVSLSVRAAGSIEAIARPIRQRIRSLDPNLPIINAEPVSARVADSIWAPRMAASLLGLFGLLALVITAIGLYGVVSYSVLQRNREIGIRMSLGAQRFEVLWLILRQSLVIAAVGVGLGLLGALAGNRLVQSLLYGVEPSDPRVFVVVTLILILVVALASLIPAWRASRVNPVTVLRLE